MGIHRRLRNVVVHAYFRLKPDVIRDIVGHEPADLAHAIHNR